MSRHVWTLILTDEDGYKWEWCIRCGALRYESTIFEHGPHQGMALMSSRGMHREKEAKKCPYKKQEPTPKDIQQWIHSLGNICGQEALDEQVHEMKGAEAADINNSGMDAQIEYLHNEAGMPWSEIRGLLGLKEGLASSDAASGDER